MKKVTDFICKSVSVLVFACIAFGASAQEEIVYYHNDALGSPIIGTSATGQVVWSEEYYPYGSRMLYEARELDCTLQPCTPILPLGEEKQWFAGKYEETEAGLLYFGARWYDPEVGRFLSPDPVQFHEDNVFSFNRYAYANNNPYRYTDPDGQSPIDVVFLAVDVSRLAMAVASGDMAAAQAAAVDVAFSAVGVASPIPGVGQALKVVKAGDKARDLGRAVSAGKSATKSADSVTKGGKPRMRVKDVTDPGAKQRNYEVDWSKGKFDQHLENSGFSKGEIPKNKGPISVFSKNGNKEYTTRGFSKSGDGGPTGELFRGGEQKAKIRFKGGD